MITTNLFQKLKTLIDEELVFGISSGVLQESKTIEIFSGVYGKSLPYSIMEVDENTVYDLASLTKVVGTTTRILQLIDEKILSLQTIVSTLLPEYPNLSMTIEELLLHRTGLPGDFEDKKNFSVEMLHQFFITYQPKNDESKTIYSDIGFLLLGMIIERVENSDLESSFQKAIFQPLRMKNTTFHPSLEQKRKCVPTEVNESRGLVIGEVHDSKAYRLGRPAGSAGLFSTLEDLVLFSRVLMDNRLPSGDSFLSDSLYLRLKESEVDGRTLGWEKLHNSKGDCILYHTGFTGTSIGLNLTTKKGLILLTNRIYPIREHGEQFLEERKKIYQQFFEEDEEYESKVSCNESRFNGKGNVRIS